MKNLFKKIPGFILMTLLAIVYLGCGFIVGYHQGYKAGQKDYISYINHLLNNSTQSTDK